MRHRERSRTRQSTAAGLTGADTRRVFKFCAIFLVTVVGARAVLDEPAVTAAVREPICRWIADGSAIALRALGVDARSWHIYVAADTFRVKIAPACDGLSAMAILTAGILAFPATWSRRCIGLAVGLPLLSVTNVLRIVALVLLGTQSRRAFELVHVYVFQVFLIAVAVAGFLVWTRTVRDEVRT